MNRTTLFGVLVVAALFAGACGPEKEEKASRPVPVTTEAAVQKDIPLLVEAIGTVEASVAVTVKSQATGQVQKLWFVEGQDVRKGDLLAELDCSSSVAALKQAQATLEKDRAQAAYARSQARRYADLVKEDYVARDQYDQSLANAESLDATVKADAALVESSRVQMAYCSIHSPISGRVGKLLVDAGNIVQANATEIVVVNQVEPVRVAFSLPEKLLSEVRKYAAGRKLEVRAAFPGAGATFERGELAFVDNAIDKTTGTITLKGVFPNGQKRLWPGQYVDVTLVLATVPDAVLVPSHAVEQGPDGLYVYVVKRDLTVEMRPVTAGRTLEGETLISKGLSAGETVVTDGQLKLIPGSKVSPRKTR